MAEMIASQVSITIFPKACGDIRMENFKSSKLLPVARNRRVAINLLSGDIGSLIQVCFLIIKGDTLFKSRLNVKSSIRK